MSEVNKAVIRAFVAAINARDWDHVATLVTDDILRHGSSPGEIRGQSRESLLAFLKAEAAAFPDSVESIHFLFGEGDLVAARLHFQGTQLDWSGPYQPTGKSLSADFLGVFRVDDGRIAETWVEFDNLNSLTQLGHYKPPDPPVR